MGNYKWFFWILPLAIFFGWLTSSVAGCQSAVNTQHYVIYSDNAERIYEAEVFLQQSSVKIVKKAKYANSMVISEAPSESFRYTFGNSIKVEPLIEVTASIVGCAKKPEPNDPIPPQPKQEIPWGIKAVKAVEAWRITRGEGILVCVVDTGTDYNHPDLKDNIEGGENLINGEDYYDDNGHGSHVAGTILASDNGIGVVGVAPEAKLFTAKVLNSWGSGSSQDVADGILSCVANGASVINMSLGSNSAAGVIESAVKEALDSGAIIVAAAGNDGTDKVGYPAAFDGVIAISATDINNELASFSQYGPEINFASPGVDINSSIPGGEYDSFNGTSMATPHAAGVVALMLSAGKSILKADDIGLSPDKQGKGLINAFKTVQ